MDIEAWKRLRQLSEECAAQPESARRLWLKARGLDDAVCDQVLALVNPAAQSHEQTDLAQAIADRLSVEVDDSESDAGARIGPWQLVEPIGVGGMGRVYRAERVEGGFKQEAAVKRMRLGLDQAQYLNRFESERQILAGLQHPHIASLLDGGTTADGMPYLALEYIQGQTIADYCDDRHLSITQRLRLFLAVCEAVSYAHRQLVIHRDIKPSNVMVTEEGQVKLLDFGVAKLLDQHALGDSTQTINPPLTPAYASPEQLQGLPASTQTDVYGLGLLLFKLCTGVLPQKARGSQAASAVLEVLTTDPLAASSAVQRLVKDDEERLRIAEARATAPEPLKRRLRGDLDAILLKALRSDAVDRYSSVDALMADIKASLDHRPVIARRGSKRYLVGRFITRNRLAVGLVSLLLLSVLVGVIGTVITSIEAQRQADQANEMRDFVADIFRRANPSDSAGGQTSARDLLDQALGRMDRSPLSDTSSQARIRTLMAEAYLSLGHTSIGHDLASQVLSEIEALGLEGDIKTDALLLKARAESERGENALALELLNQVAPRITSSPPSQKLADMYFELGRVYLSQGHIEDATLNMERAVAVYSSVLGSLSDPALNASRVLAWIYDEAERYDDIDSLIAPLIEATRDSHASGSGDYPAANPLYLADLMDAQANALSSLGQAQQAIDYRLQAVQVTADLFGERHRYTGTRWNNLAFSYLRDEQLTDAYDAMNRALLILRQSSPEGSHIIGSTASNFARISVLVGRNEQAESLIQEAISIREIKSTPTDVAFSTQIASTIARAAGDLPLAGQRADQAEALFAGLERQPNSLAQRLLQERAILDLLTGNVDNCDAAERAHSMLSTGEHQTHRSVLAYSAFIHSACSAMQASSENRWTDLDRLGEELTAALELQPQESARRVWLRRYHHHVISQAVGLER